jgi:hypothetical protein
MGRQGLPIQEKFLLTSQRETWNPLKRKREESPTSVQMRSTFTLQNHNQSFERYFTEMKKRNLAKGWVTNN